LDCGGLASPWNEANDQDQGGVKPPQSKVPSAQHFDKAIAHAPWLAS